MRTNLKRAAVLGTAGLGAVALSAGFALPAMADDGDHTTTHTATSAMSEIAPWTTPTPPSATSSRGSGTSSTPRAAT